MARAHDERHGSEGERHRSEGEPSARGFVVDVGDLRGYLGRPKFFFEAAERTAVPGVATGLAVTGVGGDVLFIEATRMDPTDAAAHGGGGLMLTGQLGDVMKESAQIALSFVRSHADELGIDRRASRDGSTSMSRRAPSPRTGRAPGSP